ncbi:MAG: hypothetical protein H8D23_28590, partial [Candidatus Brocadiales bacterium]|nr:hypothetical protein [Candidatus Brocadiales bacterium]
TLMDHLASVGRRYVQNKANLDLQREQNEFTLARDEKQQAYGLALSEGQHQNALDRIVAQGTQDVATQTAIDEGLNLRTGLITETEKEIAEGNQGVQRYGIMTQGQMNRDVLQNNLDLLTEGHIHAEDMQEMHNEYTTQLTKLQNKHLLTVLDKQIGADLVKTLNILDAQLGQQKLVNKGNLNLANIHAGTQRFGIQSQVQMNRENNENRFNLFDLSVDRDLTLQERQLKADAIGLGKQLKFGDRADKRANKTQRYGIKRGANVEESRIKTQFKTADRAFDLQERQQSQIEESQNFQLEVARHNFNESQKNQYVKAIDNIMPVLEMSGVSIDDYLASPESYSSILSKAVESNQLSRIIGSAFGGSPGYETVQERQQKVNDTLQSLNFLNALYGGPALSGATGLDRIINE